ncbi:MAG: S24 family peptidase [Nocardioidaceae bacterium]
MGSKRLGRPVFGTAVVRGRSMEPTLRDGDRLLVRYGGSPRPGQLVIVRLPDRPVAVKRAARRVDGGWWVERDNPGAGVDSWLVGTIPDDDVVACVVRRLWPPRRRSRRTR